MSVLLSTEPKDYVLWISIGFIVILIIYLIFATNTSSSIIISKQISASSQTKADLYYYLPTTSISIVATAKVLVTKSSFDNKIKSVTLIEISFENTTKLIPDTDYLFSLNYIPSIFTNDELKFNIDSSGLLQTVSVTDEDRINNIINGVTDAPQKIFNSIRSIAKDILPEATTQDITFQTMLFLNTFSILSNEIKNGTALRDWIINIDGETDNLTTKVDASFKINFSPTVTAKSLDVTGNKGGVEAIIVRPLHSVIIEIATISQTANGHTKINYEIQIPDESKLIEIPITRSAFVKKVNIPKFNSGILVENYINKPSQFEGFISIPINIARAIFSIPAQLLTFKINNIKQQTSLQTEEQNLAKTQAKTRNDITH